VGVTGDEEDASLRAGRREPWFFTGDEQRLEVSRPDGSVWVARRDQASSTRSVLYSENRSPGTYHVRAVGSDGTVVARPEQDFVVNLDTRESNPARLDPSQGPIALRWRHPESSRPSTGRIVAHPRRVMIGLLLCESVLTLRRRRI